MAYNISINVRVTKIRIEYRGTTKSAAIDLHVRGMERVGHGSNDVEWDVDQNGNTLTVSGTLREFYRYAVRSTDEFAAQSIVSKQGLADDQAGHALGHRFVLNQGLKNLFPKDANFNTSAYKTLENEMADWVTAGADVHFEISLSGYNADGRPESVNVKYKISHPDLDKPIPILDTEFTNNGNQEYTRIDQDSILKMINTPD